METNNQDQVKDLQYFKDEVAREYSYQGVHYARWENMEARLLRGIPEGAKTLASKDLILRLSEAAERYAAHLVQQAGFTLEDIKTAMIHASCMRGRVSDIQEQQIPAYISSLNTKERMIPIMLEPGSAPIYTHSTKYIEQYKQWLSDYVRQASEIAYDEGFSAGAVHEPGSEVADNPYRNGSISALQQAKDAAFKEGCEAQQKHIMSKYFTTMHKEIRSFGLAPSPYTTGEKETIVTWKEAIRDFLSFSRVTFSEATAISSMAKLEEECDEVCDVIAGKDGELAEEYADCLMCIFDSAMRAGISQDEILSAFIDKTATNKSRKWIKSPDNTYSGEKGGEGDSNAE